MIGYALTGSFCTVSESLSIMDGLIKSGYDILPIMSERVYGTDTKFGEADKIIERVRKITGKEPIHTIVGAEPLGPNVHLEALVISPCTGNTLAKLANGITDTSVCMAAKAHLRNNKPLLIALATNDALSANLKNIGMLFSRKNVYFVPMKQDNPISKPYSLVADFNMIEECLKLAINGSQYPKLFI